VNIPPVGESDIASDSTFQLRIYQYISGALDSSLIWTSPTGFVDPDTVWHDEANAYDENLVNYARGGVVKETWGSFIELTHAAINSGGCRFYAGGETADITQIDIDAEYEGDPGVWHDVYQGVFTHNEWTTKTFSDGLHSITAYRFRFYNNDADNSYDAYLYEVDFYDDTAYDYDWDLDYIFLLPLDEGVVIASDVPAANKLAIDSISDPPGVFLLDASNKIIDVPTYVGSAFTLGRENTRIYFLRDDVKGVTFAVDITYQPKFLVV